MKIRNGFVSNSSSSSFVMIVTKSEYDRVIPKLDLNQRKVIEQMDYSEKNFLDVDFVTLGYLTIADDCRFDCDELGVINDFIKMFNDKMLICIGG